MKILVTGAAGFLGRRLIAALSSSTSLPELSRIVAVDISTSDIDDARIDCRTGTITDAEFVHSVLSPDVDLVYHLAAVVSGQAEADFDLGMRVNVDATRRLLEACRCMRNAPRFVFASSIAVFGGPLPDVVPEEMAVRPQSSYGTEKAIGELLVNEYSRRGFIDGIICRLPIIAVRPGTSNPAASSFVSGIIREPITGVDTVCPVPLETRLWISSPEMATANLLHAGRLATPSLGGSRTVNLPGLSVTPAEMLASLEQLGGVDARRRVRCELDPDVTAIVTTWPGAFDIRRSLRLGFSADRDLASLVQQFITEQRLRGGARAQ